MDCEPWCDHNLAERDRLDAVFGPMPKLPPRSARLWSIRSKAAVIEAVQGGWVPIEEVCRSYMISVDQFLAWERDVQQLGVRRL
jgi:hypothetical protein